MNSRIDTKKSGLSEQEHQIFKLSMSNGTKTLKICKLRRELELIKTQLETFKIKQENTINSIITNIDKLNNDK